MVFYQKYSDKFSTAGCQGQAKMIIDIMARVGGPLTSETLSDIFCNVESMLYEKNNETFLKTSFISYSFL